jgi:hypothetical protein
MSCSKAVSAISFAEIIHGRDASVRVTHDGFIYAVDLVMVVSDLERNQAGLALRRVIEKNLLSIKMIERNTGGKGNARTQLVNLTDALQLIMVLPGDMAKTVRAQIGDIMTKFFAGDESLVDQIRANAESNSPIAQLARASLGGQDPEDPEARRKRIKREDLELAKMEEEIMAMRASTQEKNIKNFNDSLASITHIRPDWLQTDKRLCLQMEDTIKNIMTSARGTTQSAITNGAPAAPASLSISQLAQELGCKPLTHSLACSAGRLAAKRYKALHSTDPPKHRQWVDGAERAVNSYTEADRELLTAVLSDLCLVPSSSNASVAGSED